MEQLTINDVTALIDNKKLEGVYLDLAYQLRDTMCENERLREALIYIRDIEKPMTSSKPETDWLSWYTTSSQQTECAEKALSSSNSKSD